MPFRSVCATAMAVGLILLAGGGIASLTAGEVQIITTPQLKQWLASAQKPLLVYTLSQVEFYEQRIPGSVCIPTEEIQRSGALPEKKDTPMVFYCLGPG